MWMRILWGCLLCLAAPAWATPAFDEALEHERDAQTLSGLSADGQVLYQRESVKLDGYQYCSQSVAASERGDFRDAVRAASKALFLGQSQGNEDLMALSKRDLAIAYSYAGDLQNAAKFARQALEHRAKNPAAVAGPAYKTLGDVAVRRKRLEEALSYYQQASEAASDKYRPLVLISLANAYLAADMPQRARGLFGRIQPPQGSLLPMYQRSLGNLLMKEERPAQALEAFQSAARYSRGIDAGYNRLWALDGVARSRQQLGDRQGARDALMAAVKLADGIRARFRSEEFKSGLFGDVQQVFERAIAMLADAGEHEAAWALSERSRSRALLDVVRGRVAASEETLTAAPVTLRELQAVLAPDETVVEFHSLEDRLLAWVIDAQGMRGHGLALPRARLGEAVEDLRATIFTKGPVSDVAADLGRRLLAPLELPDGRRLVMVPHGTMHYLPFQALRTADAYLVERHALAVVPSASLAVQLRRRPVADAGILVAFGNPANASREALPGAEREVRRISALFPDGKAFYREQASKARLREAVRDSKVLHIAAHAQADALDPLHSRILLATDGADPGFLEAAEVYGIDLHRVSLVALSACASGLGQIARGDEIMGFTRSFLSAGAAALLVSLWPVADDSTELLMDTFYGALSRGASVDDAMRQAQTTLLRHPAFSHPFHWAPFDLVGDWRLRLRSPAAAG